MTFRSGYCAIVGRPNSGKSTLLNAILGEKLSIVTAKPQTTRHRIAGILSDENSQLIFLDTPGYHVSQKALNRVMNDIVDTALEDADVVCLLVPANEKDLRIEKGLFERIGEKRCIVVVNKCDLVDKSEFESIALKYRDDWGAKELVVLSALKGFGVQTLVSAIRERLPEGPAYFPDDIYTDRPVRFLAAEMIREELFEQMQEEIPYSSAVEIEDFKDATAEKPVTVIMASIVVEKESQKGMVIGKGGRRIKEIGKKSRLKIEKLVGGKVFLDLQVKVEENWTKDSNMIKKLGYTNQND